MRVLALIENEASCTSVWKLTNPRVHANNMDIGMLCGERFHEVQSCEFASIISRMRRPIFGDLDRTRVDANDRCPCVTVRKEGSYQTEAAFDIDLIL